MKRHWLFIVLVVLAFSFGLFSFRAKALTLSGTARSMIVQVMDSNGNILDGVHSAISGISYPNMIVQVMNSSGTILDNFGITLPGGGAAAALPQTYWDLTAGGPKNLSALVPAATMSGAVRVELCVASGGAGGGGAATGGTAAVCGGTGGSGANYCVTISGTTLTNNLSGITYTIGAGGGAPSCGVSATAGGAGGSSSIALAGQTLAQAGNNNAGAGVNATTTTAGTGGTAAGAATSKTFAYTTAQLTFLSMTSVLAGQSGSTGGADAPAVAPFQAGGYGGQGACVTSGGVCDASNPGTAGGPGYFKATFYFQ